MVDLLVDGKAGLSVTVGEPVCGSPYYRTSIRRSHPQFGSMSCQFLSIHKHVPTLDERSPSSHPVPGVETDHYLFSVLCSGSGFLTITVSVMSKLVFISPPGEMRDPKSLK